MMMLIGMAAHGAAAGKACSLDGLAMGMFALGVVLLTRAACLVCRSPYQIRR